MGQDKTMQGRDEKPILRPRPAPLPSLFEPPGLAVERPLIQLRHFYQYLLKFFKKNLENTFQSLIEFFQFKKFEQKFIKLKY